VNAAPNGVARSKLVTPTGEWRFLIDFLTQRFKHIPRSELLQRMLRGDMVCSTGTALNEHTPFRSQQAIYYFRDVPTEVPVPFEEQIIFQDDEILVADKPPFLTVVPAGQHLHETLLVRLRKRTGLENLVPMHRIDRETSGLVMFTLNPATRGKYQSLFEAKKINKRYEAIARVNPKLVFPLTHASRIEESASFMQMHEVVGEPNSVTHIHCVETKGPLGKFDINPETGKKHQIRIHFAALGMPICNDQIYPVLMPQGQDDYERPLKLLAKAVSFVDPLSGEQRAFESPRSLSLN
jgi:tRNA pseudouridine32 synthase / 23S rRNA pseudouridine746 synthase